MSDILPVCLQDFLYSRKSELRKHKIIFIMKYMPGSGLEAAACFLWLCIRGEKSHR